MVDIHGYQIESPFSCNFGILQLDEIVIIKPIDPKDDLSWIYLQFPSSHCWRRVWLHIGLDIYLVLNKEGIILKF